MAVVVPIRVWMVALAAAAVLLGARLAEAVQVVKAEAAAAPLQLQIVHLNDFHARFEPVSRTASACKEGDKCIGGLARVAAAIAAERSRNADALVLNGGDNFQGTLWYSLFRGNATGHFMSELPWDALVGRAVALLLFRTNFVFGSERRAQNAFHSVGIRTFCF